MRVTNRFLYDQLVKDIGKSTEKLFKLNGQISSGKRIDRPSEDPLGLSRVLVNRTELNAFEQYQKAIDFTNGWLSRTDSIVNDVDDLLGRASELAVQMSSATQDAAAREGAAEEIKQIREMILGHANAKYGNKYIFSGTMTQTKPFLNTDVELWQDDVAEMLPISVAPPATPADGDRYIDTTDNHIYEYSTATSTWSDEGAPADGSRYINSTDSHIFTYTLATNTLADQGATAEGTSATITDMGELYVYQDGQWSPQYAGNNSTFSVKIGKTDTAESNIPGDELYRNPSGDVFMSLMNLEKSLRDNDIEGIRDALPEIENSSKTLMNMLAKVGAVVNRLDHTETVIQRAETDNKETTSDIEDLDYAEALTSLQNQQTIYQAALKSASLITSMSLVDYV